jgi:hypothetical protein
MKKEIEKSETAERYQKEREKYRDRNRQTRNACRDQDGS